MSEKWSDIYEAIFYGDEILIDYRGKKYFIQGWYQNDLFHLEMWEYYKENPPTLFEADKQTRQECADLFLSAKLFDGKTIKDVLDDVEWVDD